MDREQLIEFSNLYERHAADVHAYALRRSDRDTADDATAQVFLIAWRRRSSIPDQALPWLLGVTRRVLSEQRRAASRRRKLQDRLRMAAVEPCSPPDLDDERLAEALNQLSDANREVLLLRYWEELGPAEVARVMGCTKPTVAVRLHRARRRLRRELDLRADPRREVNEQTRSCAAGTEPA